MSLMRLMYMSEIKDGISINIKDLLKIARQKNAQNNITGMLWFDGRRFIQVLEGARDAVSSVYHKICKDPRHHNISVMNYGPAMERMFAEWSMGYYTEDGKNMDALSASPDKMYDLISSLNIRG